MNGTLQRKGVASTIGDGIEWLGRNPILIVVFFLYGLLELVGEFLGPLGSVVTLLGYLVYFYLNGLVYVIGRDEAMGDPVDLGRASSVVLGQFVSLIGVFIVYALAVGIGLILLIVPGLYLGARLSLALPACVIDEQDVFESLDTSWSVAKGNLLKLFGIFLVSFLIAVGTTIATLLVTGFGEGFYLALLAVSAVLTAVVTPVVQFAYARVYLENRAGSAGDEEDHVGW